MNYMGRQRLVIYDNGKAGRTGYIVNYMPSKAFQGILSDVNALNFRYRKFSGGIAVYTLKQESIGNFIYANGKFVERRRERKIPSGGDIPEGWVCTSTTTWECTTIDGEYRCDEVFTRVCEWVPDPDECDLPNPPSYCGGSDPCDSPNPPPGCTGGDPCDSPNPPAYCSGGDPCDGPNPPPSCTGGGDDCLTGDCLNCELHPEDPRCCKCNNRSEKKHSDQVEFNYAYVTRLNINIEVGLTSKNCKTGTANCSNNFYPFNPPPSIAEISIPINNVEVWATQPYPGTTNCGFNSTYWSRGLITVIPRYLAVGEVANTKSFEGWPNFNID